jgi:hypothetical protein
VNKTTDARRAHRGAAMPETPTPTPDIDRLAAIVEELRRQHDPRRSAAEQAEYAAMAAKYPGQFVAFLDTWDGEKLTREVIAASESLSEFHRQMRAYPDYEARRREIAVTQIRDPNDDAINVPSLWFDDEQPAG